MRQREPLRGAPVVVTGAASGIGRALAEALHTRGARLALIDVDADRLAAVGEPLGALTEVVDLRDVEALSDAAARILAALGPPRMVFANAGVAAVGPLAEVELQDASWVIEVNLVGALATTRAFLPAMLGAGRGAIVYTASIAGLVGAPGMSVYSASKFGVVGLAESLRFELAGTGVTATTVCPGYVPTGLHAATRYANEGFRRFLDGRRRGPSPERVAERAIDAGLAGRPRVVMGAERIGVWLHRLSPALYHRVTATVANALGLIGRERSPSAPPHPSGAS